MTRILEKMIMIAPMFWWDILRLHHFPNYLWWSG